VRIEAQQQQMMKQVMEQLRIHSVDGSGNEMPNQCNLHFNPKVEFPSFDGSDPKEWVKKCTRYFSLCWINEDQKVDLAALHLKGPAEVWFGSYMLGRRNISWEKFILDVYARFRDNLGSKVVEDFNRLQQLGTLEEYLQKIWRTHSTLVGKNSTVPEAYFLESFTGGLKPAIKSFVRALNPQTLDAAMEFTRLQEETIQALKIPPDRTMKPYTPHISKLLLPAPNPPTKAVVSSFKKREAHRVPSMRRKARGEGAHIMKAKRTSMQKKI